MIYGCLSQFLFYRGRETLKYRFDILLLEKVLKKSPG